MKGKHRTDIAERFLGVYLQKQILVLDILDIYRHRQPGLIKALRAGIRNLSPEQKEQLSIIRDEPCQQNERRSMGHSS